MTKYNKKLRFVPNIIRFKSLCVKFIYSLDDGADVYFYNCLYDFINDILYGDLMNAWRQCLYFEVRKVRL